MTHVKIVFLEIAPDDLILASRAARYHLERTDGGKETILVYGEGTPAARTFFVKRNKASITVRPC